MNAEIITSGTELLLGEIVDTNSTYIARALRDIGVNLYYKTSVGDNVERMAAVVEIGLGRSDLIIITGGLGPTVDDVTREAVARATGRELALYPECLASIEAIFARWNRQMSENNRRQAYLPAGSAPILNPVGTAPGFIIEGAVVAAERAAGATGIGASARDATPGPESSASAARATAQDGAVRGDAARGGAAQGATVIALPGVPREMEYLMQNAVLPYLRERLAAEQAVIKARTLRTVALGESWIDERIDDLMRAANPTVGLAAHFGIVDIRITARAGAVAEADAMIARMEAAVRSRLRDGDVFGVEGDRLEDVTGRLLAEAHARLALVESSTGGEVARRLRSTPEGAAAVTRAEVVDGPEALARLLNMSLPKLDTYGFSSEMAAAGAAALLSDTYEAGWGLAVLGDLEARDDVYGAETGQTFAALVTPGDTRVRHYPYGGRGELSVHWVTVRVLDLLRRAALERLSARS